MISPSLRVGPTKGRFLTRVLRPGAGVFMDGVAQMVRAARSGNDSPEGRHSSVNGGSIPSPSRICFALILLVVDAHADTWVRCKPGTLIRTEPEPRCVGTAPQPMVCPPVVSCIESEKEAAECKRINAGLLSERDSLAALHQREAADNRRCKKNLKKCRGRK